MVSMNKRGHGSARSALSVRRLLVLITACIAAVTVGVSPDAVSESRSSEPVLVDDSSLTFPRTGTIFLDQDKLPSIDQLARYDVVVIDAEWQNRLPRSFFAELRRKDPRIKLLSYVNLIDSMQQTGSPGYWANAYSLWQFNDSTTSQFPRAWLAYTAKGKPVHEWPDRIMTNLTDAAPRVNGQIYAQYAANWVVDHVWSTGIWDGIFLDVWGDRVYTADSDHWDINGDGVDEPDSAIYGPGGPLDRGLSIAENIMRSRMPTALLVANGHRDANGGKLDGLAFESFADVLADPDRVEDHELSKYVQASVTARLRKPSMLITIDQRRTVTPGSADDYRRARFFLTASLMQDAWWAPMGADYAEPTYYDEMDGGGLGRGYLGHPLVADPDLKRMGEPSTEGTGSPAPGAYRRDFENGIALVNTGDQPRTISLERSYRHLSGTQDPDVNNGVVVKSVTIPSKDGVILLRIR